MKLPTLSIKISIITLFASLFAAAFIMPSPVAQAAPDATACNKTPSFIGINPWTDYLPCKPGVGPTAESYKDITGLAFWAADSVLKLAGYIAVAMVIWGGIKYIKSNGDSGQIAEAKETIIQALVGMGICIASIAIVNFVSGIF